MAEIEVDIEEESDVVLEVQPDNTSVFEPEGWEVRLNISGNEYMPMFETPDGKFQIPITSFKSYILQGLTGEDLDTYYLNYANLINKPTISTVGGSGLFSDILGKPTTINGYGITDAIGIGGGTIEGPFSVNTINVMDAGGIRLNNSFSNLISFVPAGVAPPTVGTRSVGTKIVLYSAINPSNLDYALGIDGATLWQSVPTNNSSFKWYGGTTLAATLTGSGILTLENVLQSKGISSTGNINALDGSFIAKSSTPNTGYILIGPGSTTSTGLISLYHPNGARIGYYGFNTTGVGITADLNFHIDLSTSGSGVVRANGLKVWTAGLTGTGSNVDSDLLDGQHGSYYLNYNNLTNKPSAFNGGIVTAGILATAGSVIQAGAANAGSSTLVAGNSTNAGYLAINNSANARVGYVGYNNAGLGINSDPGYPIEINAGTSQRVVILSSGHTSLAGPIDINNAYGLIGYTCVCNIGFHGVNDFGIGIKATVYDESTNVMLMINSSGTLIGSIGMHGTAVSFNTTSDETLKNVLGKIENSGEIIDAIEPLFGNWKEDENQYWYGFLAQQLYKHVPYAVSTGQVIKGMYKPWQVDKSALVPLAIAEIKELRIRAKEQEEKVSLLTEELNELKNLVKQLLN